MVLSCGLETILNETSNHSIVSLPSYKDPGLKLEFSNCKDIETVYKDKAPPLPFARSEIYHAEILSWSRLTPVNEGCKAVYEITFDVKGSNFEFKAGDTIGILPQNRTEEVNIILEHLGITTEADLGYNLSLGGQKGTKIPAHIPVKSTLRHVLTHCVELRSVLKKLFILALSRHTKCDIERKSLEYLCSKEGSAAYTEHILNKNKCILDIFTIFKTCKPPIEILLAHLPRLLPRPYSVVNSGLKDSSVLKICFSVMEIGNNRQGLTSGLLESMLLGMESKEVQKLAKQSLESRFSGMNIEDRIETVLMYHRKNMSEFSLPPNVSTHLIMIATGTGVAPFMGFLEERELQQATAQSDIGEAWLFFGCRNPQLDYIYQGMMEEYQESMVLNKLITAFSRVKSVEARRIQNSLCDNGKDVVRLIENGASVFVCGEAKTMVSQVKESVIGLLVKHGGKSTAEAEEFVTQMEKDKRYVVDLWS